MNINVSLIVQSLKLHKIRQARHDFITNEDGYGEEDRDMQICRKALSDFRKQLRYFLHKGDLKDCETTANSAPETHTPLLSGTTLGSLYDAKSPSANSLDSPDLLSGRPNSLDKKKEVRVQNSLSNREHRRDLRKKPNERLESLVNGVGMTLGPSQKESLRAKQFSERSLNDTEVCRSFRESCETLDSLQIRAIQNRVLPQLSGTEGQRTSEVKSSFRSPAGEVSYSGSSPGPARHGNNRFTSQKASGESADSQKYRFQDPSIGANSSFVHKLAELSNLQAETLRYERLKAIKNQSYKKSRS